MQLDPGLLAAVIKNPDDDLPRLIAADWLEEHGEQIEAQLIRSQLADPTSIQHGTMTVRKPLGPECSNETNFPVGIRCDVTFVKRRGFIESITTCWFDWACCVEVIRESVPLREVRLNSWWAIEVDGRYDQPDAVVRDFLNKQWPGITFINTGLDC
jgi:uncharacterized protein (TIGR02996 family)